MVTVDLTMGKMTRFGHTLYDFWYRNEDLQDLAPGLTGWPHDGGEHACSITGSYDELVAFLELYVEAYPEIEREIGLLRLALGDTLTKTIKLKTQCHKTAEYLLWRYHRPGRFFGDHEGDNVYLEEDLIKANFKAFKAYLMRADPSVISFAEFAKPYYLEARK